MPSRASARQGPLTGQAAALWRDQLRDWSMLRDGADRLSRAEMRTLTVNGRAVRLQHNPGRAVSATAKVDPAAVAARRCFLCPQHLPPEQRAIAVAPEWWLLCNPAPIFSPHFVSASTEHVPQRVESAVPALLDLARAFEGDFVAFYNGPGAGASAPDHLHLQAVPADELPFATLVAGAADWQQAGPLETGRSSTHEWPAIAFRGDDPAALSDAILRAVRVLADVCPADPEPRLNLYALWQGDHWLAWFVPRRAHRPNRYGTGPGEILVSPGAIELGGVVITPRAEDFAALTADDLAEVFSEVHLAAAQWAGLLAGIQQP